MNGKSETERDHSGYSKTIKVTGWVFAIIAAVISVAAFFSIMAEPAEDTGETMSVGERIAERKVFAGLIIFPFGGYLLGMALAVLLAPKSYLLSSDGKKWMDMVGTKTVGSARVVSLIFVLFGVALLGFMGLALLTDDFKKPLF